MDNKKNIRTLPEEELEKFLIENNYKLFRKKQIYEWVWNKRVSSFDEMKTISKNLRLLLKNNFKLQNVTINKMTKSIDGTVKYSMMLYDKKLIEGVLIPSKKRMTACVSSQVGCSLSCSFCATGLLNLERNLNYGELFEQVLWLLQKFEDFFLID